MIISKIKKIYDTPEKRTIIENFFSLSLLKGATVIIPIIIIPFLIQSIGLDLVGKLALILAISVYFNTVIEFGFSYTGVREVAQNNNDREKNTKVFFDILYAKVFLSIACVIGLIIIGMFNRWVGENQYILFLALLQVAILSISPSWFFQGVENMKLIAIGEVLGKVFSFLMILIYVKTKQDFILIFYFYLIGQILSLCFYIYAIKPYIYFKSFNNFTIKEVYYKLESSWNIFINILAPNLYNSYSYIVLAYFGNLKYVAIYDISRKILNISEQGINIVSKVFFPTISRDIENHKLFLKVILCLALLLALMNAFVAYFLTNFLVPINVNEVRTLLYIQSIAPFILALMVAYGLNYLIPIGQDLILRNITLFCSLIGFFIVTGLTYKFLAIGALIGVMLTWLLRFILCYHYASKISYNLKAKKLINGGS